MSAVAGLGRPRAAGSPRRPSRSEPIPFAGLKRQHALLAEELTAAFRRVLVADAFILGSEVEAFEQEFAAFCGTRHCVGVASGTAAIALTLIASGIGPGDEVLVPAHTFIASALGVLHAGATPVFCDVERNSGLIDARGAAALIGERTAAVLAVHLYGQACEMSSLRAVAKRHGLLVLEDAAQAHGATYRGVRVGAWGDAAAFSFYPSKNLGALGDGGGVCTNDGQLADRLRQLRDLGQQGKGNHLIVGYNERLDGLQAALLRIKLPYLDLWNEARRDRARYLRARLPPELVTLEERPDAPCVYHLFPVRHPERDRLARLLRATGIQIGVHYSPAAHRHPAFDYLPRSSRPVELPEAEAWAREELTLPIYPELTDAELTQVAAACHSFFSGA